MRILFDARGVGVRADGLSNYVRHLLVHLLQLNETDEYVVLLTPSFWEELKRGGWGERPRTHPIVTTIPFMGPVQQVRLPWLACRLPRADVYHYLHFDMPLAVPTRSVVTIFDVNHVQFPTYFDSLRWLKRGYSVVTTALSLAKATHVVTISHTTKRQLLSCFSWVDPDHVTVVYCGLNDRFGTAFPASAQVGAFRRRYGLGAERFILYVGTSRPHKNLPRLLEAYSRLRRSAAIPHRLVWVGSAHDGGAVQAMIKTLSLEGAVMPVGYLEAEELPLAYAAAEAFVFCSLSEGFGMPLLEAMASGVPIVTSNTGTLAEIVGDSAIRVDPYSVDAIAEGLQRVLTSEPMRRDLSQRGRQRVEAFSWEKSAKHMREIYARVSGIAPSSRPSATDPRSPTMPLPLVTS